MKEANTAVERELEEQKTKTHFTHEHRAKIGKYAAECSNAASVRHFSYEFPILGERNVRLPERVTKQSSGEGS